MNAVSTSPAPPGPLTVTIRRAVAETGISRAQLYRLAGAGKIIFRKSGSTTLVDWVSLAEHVANLPPANIRQAA